MYHQQELYNQLSKQHQSIIDIACQAANVDMISDYMSKNYQALEYFKENVQIKKFPSDVLSKLKIISDEVLLELIERANSLKKYMTLT